MRGTNADTDNLLYPRLFTVTTDRDSIMRIRTNDSVIEVTGSGWRVVPLVEIQDGLGTAELDTHGDNDAAVSHSGLAGSVSKGSETATQSPGQGSSPVDGQD